MSIRATMRALEQSSFNGPQDMSLITDAPVPVPGKGEVLIRVAAAGVNFADISKAYGKFLGGPRPPYVAGFEAAGEIVAAQLHDAGTTVLLVTHELDEAAVLRARVIATRNGQVLDQRTHAD